MYTARNRHLDFELAPLAAKRVSLEEGLREADVVSVHTPLQTVNVAGQPTGAQAPAVQRWPEGHAVALTVIGTVRAGQSRSRPSTSRPTSSIRSPPPFQIASPSLSWIAGRKSS